MNEYEKVVSDVQDAPDGLTLKNLQAVAKYKCIVYITNRLPSKVQYSDCAALGEFECPLPRRKITGTGCNTAHFKGDVSKFASATSKTSHLQHYCKYMCMETHRQSRQSSPFRLMDVYPISKNAMIPMQAANIPHCA